MKTICMLAANDLLNDPRVTKQAKSAAEAGFDVVVIGVRSSRSKPFEIKDGYKIIRIKVQGPVYNLIKYLYRGKSKTADKSETDSFKEVPLKSSLWKDLKYLIISKQLNYNLAQETLKQTPDIVHCNDLDTLFAGYLIKKKLRTKLLYDSHEVFISPHIPHSKFWFNVLKRLEKKAIPSADCVISVSPSILEFLSREYSTTSNMHAILNCPLYKDTTFVTEKNNNLPESKKRVLYQGKYEKYRGLEEIIKASQFFKDAILVLRGYGYIENQLKKLAEDSKVLNKKVFFLEPVAMSDMVNEAVFADIGILPYQDICLSHKFCLPNKVFEYMMAGLAIAASDLVELNKLINKTKAGVIFNPESPQDIAEKINQLTGDEAKLKECKRQSLFWSKNKYNWEKESGKLIDIYKELVKL